MEETLALTAKITYRTSLSYTNILSNMYGAYWRQGKYQKAKEVSSEELAIHQKMGWKEMEASDFLSLATVQQDLAEYEEAGQNYQKVLAFFDEVLKSPNNRLVVTILNNWVGLELTRGNYSLCDSLLQRAWQVNALYPENGGETTLYNQNALLAGKLAKYALQDSLEQLALQKQSPNLATATLELQPIIIIFLATLPI
ncbi:MAG: hypothetical protein HC892_11200 [Saprospiraceae bacterium]|nr:hypothetical protein [Saprospiraceae bacterium]